MPAESDPIDPPHRRRPVVALLTGTLWLGAVAALAVVATRVLAARALGAADLLELVASLILQVAAPLAVVLVALELARRSGSDGARLDELEARNHAAAAATTAIRDGLLDVDATLAAIASRVETLRATSGGTGDGLVDIAGRLEQAAVRLHDSGTTVGDAAARLDAALPASAAQADAIAATLAATGTDATRQLDSIETLLAGVWTRHADAAAQAETAGAAMTRLLGEIEAAAVRAAHAITDRTSALGGTVDAALDRTTAALDATRDGVHVQTSALLASVDQARVALDQIGGEAARVIGKRVDRVIAAAEQLNHQLGDADERSRAMIEAVERSFTVLDARVGHAATMSHTTLDGIAARMTSVREQVATIHAPLGETGAALRGVEEGVARLAIGTGDVVAAMGRDLPAQRDAVAALTTDVGDLAAAAARLGEPIDAARDAIEAAGVAFAWQRGTLEDAAARLMATLDDGRATLGAIEEQATGGALTASSQLIEVLGRVREVANATAGQMRTTLGEVVAEAEAALDAAGTARADAAFGEPIRREIAGLEAASMAAGTAAQAAAERVAQRLIGLTQAVATVESRIDEVDTRFEVRLRDDLARRSAALLDSLRDNAIDIAKLLAIDVSDTDWIAYLKGDRSLFARRAVRLIDSGTARKIGRHFKHDPEFAEQATRYIDEFEQLLARVKPDRDGRALAVTLVSSDIGKLYVALEQGIERLR